MKLIAGTDKPKTILQILESRKETKPGSTRYFPIKVGNDKVEDGYVFVSILTASQIDDAKMIGEMYAKAVMKNKESLTESYAEILSDAQACAAIALAMRDPYTKERIFSGPNEVDKLRSMCTEEELFFLHQMVNCVSFEFANSESIDETAAMQLAEMAANGNTQPLEQVHVMGLIRIIALLAKRSS